jgi:hypothetical protein
MDNRAVGAEQLVQGHVYVWGMEKALRFPLSIVGSLGRLSGEKQWECGEDMFNQSKRINLLLFYPLSLTLYYDYRNLAVVLTPSLLCHGCSPRSDLGRIASRPRVL